MSQTKEGETMSDVLLVFQVVFNAMTFIVLLITLIVVLIKAMKNKKK
jgi:hypothetical protein